MSFLKGKKINLQIFKLCIPYLVIIGLIFAVYFKSLSNDFTYLDDNALILERESFLSDFSNIFTAFKQDVFNSNADAYYRPILTISFIIDYFFGQLNPFFYHLTNIIIHALTAAFLFIFLQKLKFSSRSSFVATLIFAIHPVLTQAVSWVPGRNDSLLALFTLLSLIFLIEFLNKGNYFNLFFSAITFLGALFTKETAIALVLIYPLLIFSFKEFRKSFEKYLYISLFYFFPIVIWFFFRLIAMETPIEISIDSILESGLSSPLVFLVYLGKIFLLFNLSVYPILENTSLLWGIFSILILGSVLIFCRKKLDWKKVIFALVWFVIFLAPSLIRPNPDIKSDYLEHRLYLPFIGFLVLALSVFETNVLKNYLKPLLIIALLLILAVINLNHQNNFKNRISFWENAVTNSPHSPLANRNYGAMLYLDGDLERAKGYFEKALELNSNEQMAHNNLGVIYMEKGDYEKAEEEFSKEVEINQGYVSAYSNLGILYLKMEKYDEALKNLEIAVQLNPSDLSLYYNALVACVNLEDVDCTKGLLSFFEKIDVEIDDELMEKAEILIN